MKKITISLAFLLFFVSYAFASWYSWAQIWGKDETHPGSAINNISRSQQEKLYILANVLRMSKDFSEMQDAVSQGQASGFKVNAQLFANSFPADEDKQTLIDQGAEAIKYDGTPYYSYGYFCCNQPAWRAYLKEAVELAVETGADGFSLINGDNEQGRCFCSSCEAYFRDYLENKYTAAEIAAFGISDIDTFDYSAYLHNLGYTDNDIYGDNDKSSIPLLEDYKTSNDQLYLSFVNELINIVKTYGQNDIILCLNSEGPLEASNIKYSSFEVYSFYTDFDVLGSIFSYKEKNQVIDYKLNQAVFPTSAFITQPVDLSLGGIVTNTSDPEKYLYGCIAEALANKVSYYDVHDFGLWDNVWLDWSIAASINLKVKNFLQEYYPAFDYANLQSYAKIGVLYSSKTQLKAQRVRQVTAKQSFTGLGKALAKSGFQFDVIFNGDGALRAETISAAALDSYDVVIIPGTYALTNQARTALLGYANAGGNLIAYGEMDSALSLTPGETSYGSGKIYYNATDVPKSYAETASETNRGTIESDVNTYLSGKIVAGINQTHIIPQVWETATPKRVYLHLINHDIENKATNLSMTLELPSKFGANKLYLVSPDLTESEITYTTSGQSISFTVAELDVWDLLILTSTEEAQAAAQRESIINSMACGPNPATSNSSILYNLAEPAILSIKIYSITGELIKVLTDTYTLGDSVRSTAWNLTNANNQAISNGVYIYILEATGESGKVSREKGKIIVYR